MLGAGGDEANLFATDVYGMLQRFCHNMGWSFTLTDENKDERGGLKEASVMVQGKDCYRLLKFEAGVHCVKRVPATETMGRVHTSTISVLVLPKPVKVI
jgi:peptide chain release factor 1